MLYEIEMDRRNKKNGNQVRSILCVDYKLTYTDKCIRVEYKKHVSDNWQKASSSLIYSYIIREALTGRRMETIK